MATPLPQSGTILGAIYTVESPVETEMDSFSFQLDWIKKHVDY
jgi:hypothetical protein